VELPLASALPNEIATITCFETLFFQLLFRESLRDLDIFFLGTAIIIRTNNFDIIKIYLKN
jgi:hypothetical protein